MTTTLDLLSQFEDEITTSNRLPYLQIQNPPNMSLACDSFSRNPLK